MSESHVAKYFDLALDDCFIKSSSDSGDELNIQIIENGRPLFTFVKVRTNSHSGNLLQRVDLM